jgi:HD-like signal output (HDOD) protein
MNERRILVVHPDAQEGGALAAHLHQANASWRIEPVADRASFERSLLSRPADALIVDGSLPGVQPEALFKTASTQCPAAFRLALSGNYDHGTTLRTMGYAHQNLWKPCAPAEIQSALARAFALRDALHNDRLQLLIAQINTLPSLPRLYLDFLDEIRRKHPSTARLGDIIRQDLSLCSKMLQLVNSAFFGLPHKLDNPEQALLYLGLENVRALVLSIQVFSLFDRIEVKPFSLEALWEHSWRVGGLARRIAAFEERPAEEIETAFTAGVLHDLGKLVLVSGVPRAWREAIAAADAGSIPLWQAERSRLAATHAEVGAALLALWGLSDPIVEAVAFHHEPEVSGSNSFCALTAVHAANLLVKGEALDGLPYLESLGLAGRIEHWRGLAGESAR